MKIGGVEKLSLVDYPGKIATALFTIGCNMRCGYCHNPELVLPERYADVIPTNDVLQFLASRKGKIEGVVISGGEPTIHDDLPELIRSIKAMGFLVKLDTNGTHPNMLAELYRDKLIDFVSMDIKGAAYAYQEIAAYPIDMSAVKKSIQIIMSFGVEYEFRTTVVRSQIPREDFAGIGALIKGAKSYALQRFRPGLTLNPRFRKETTYSDDEFKEIRQEMQAYVMECIVR